MPDAILRDAGWPLATFAYAWLSGLVPVLNCEVYLLWLAANAPRKQLILLIVMATLGQMTAKVLLFWIGRGVGRVSLGSWTCLSKHAQAISRWHSRTGGMGQGLLVFVSASTGLPPFYVTSAGCGALKWSFPSFLLCGTAGRLLRFSAALLVPAAMARRLPNAWTLVTLIALAAVVPILLRGARKAAPKTAARWSPQDRGTAARR